MEINQETRGDVVIIFLSGQIQNGSDAAAFQGKILEYVVQGGFKKIIVDLSAVEWLSSVGVGMFIVALTTIKKNQGKLKLAGLTKEIKDLLAMTKPEKMFAVSENVGKALKSFDQK